MPPRSNKPASAASSSKRNTTAGGARVDERDTLAFLNNPSWIDRIEKELYAQREYNSKWAFMNDPKLYQGENGPSSYPSKPKVEKWSPYSILNPPTVQGNRPYNVPDATDVPESGYKITTSSSSTSSSTKSRPHLSGARAGSFVTSSNDIGAGGVNRRPGSSSSISSSPSTEAADAAFSRYVAFKTKRFQSPQKTYKFPATTTQEYGWGWGMSPDDAGTHKLFNKLEKFGNRFDVHTKV